MTANQGRVILTNVSSVAKRISRCFCVKRKFPIDPESAQKLPIFDYGHSKSSYNRVFLWGCVATGALGLPYKTKELRDVENIRSPKRSFLGEKYEVLKACCGLGFSAFAAQVDGKATVFGTGLNSDSQIGYHEVTKGNPLEILYFPQPIRLRIKNEDKLEIRKLSGGRAHLAILTNEGLFLLGNNAYGQCAREVIEQEKYIGSRLINHIPNIDDKEITDVECGQDHTLAITSDGSVYGCGWGADGQTGLGHFKSSGCFTKLEGDIASEKIVKISSRSDFVLAMNDKGAVFGWGNSEYAQISLPENCQQVNTPTYIERCASLGQIKDIATSGTQCLVVNENGEVFTWGYGMLGAGKVELSFDPIPIPSVIFGRNEFQPECRVESVVCGISHCAAITNMGDLYTWGRNRSGCLGFGHTKDQNFPLKVSLGGYVKSVSCGFDHTIAICKPFV